MVEEEVKVEETELTEEELREKELEEKRKEKQGEVAWFVVNCYSTHEI